MNLLWGNLFFFLWHYGDSFQGNWPDLIMLIDETTTAESRQEVANNLVKLFLGQGLLKEFLDVLFKLELDKTSKYSKQAHRVSE